MAEIKPYDTTYEITENPVYDPVIRAIKNSDPINAETIVNPLIKQIITNVHAVKLSTDGNAENALPKSSYTATDILTKIKTVDGANSGLDADLLDGKQLSEIQNYNNLTNKPLSLPANGGNSDTVDNKHASEFATAEQGTKAENALPKSSYTATDILTKIKTVDGANSGLDADLLDGKHAHDFVPQISEPNNRGVLWLKSDCPIVSNLKDIPPGTYRCIGQTAAVLPKNSHSWGFLSVFQAVDYKFYQYFDFSNNLYWKHNESEWQKYARVEDIPTKLPANGGNADTLNGYSEGELAKSYCKTYNFSNIQLHKAYKIAVSTGEIGNGILTIHSKTPSSEDQILESTNAYTIIKHVDNMCLMEFYSDLETKVKRPIMFARDKETAELFLSMYVGNEVGLLDSIIYVSFIGTGFKLVDTLEII